MIEQRVSWEGEKSTHKAEGAHAFSTTSYSQKVGVGEGVRTSGTIFQNSVLGQKHHRLAARGTRGTTLPKFSLNSKTPQTLYRYTAYTAIPLIPLYRLYRYTAYITIPLISLYRLYRYAAYTAIPLIPLYRLYRYTAYTAIPLIPLIPLYR